MRNRKKKSNNRLRTLLIYGITGKVLVNYIKKRDSFYSIDPLEGVAVNLNYDADSLNESPQSNRMIIIN